MKRFFKLVEIRTKAASLIPFLLGTVYAGYRFHVFRPVNFALMFASLLLVDMATTAINNYMDYKTARKREGYGYEHHNAIAKYGMREGAVVLLILVLLSSAILLGIGLVLRTNVVVLLLGAASFAVGILYSSGPVPISHTPFGELISGCFMGLGIPFLAVYIQVYDWGLLSLRMEKGILGIQMNLMEVLFLVLLSLPALTGVANIMLANNICDREEDIENGRYTLPVYIGRKSALVLYRVLYDIGFGALVVLPAAGVVPPLCTAALGTIFFVGRNVRRFSLRQTKKETFILSVQNFAVINTALLGTMALAVLWETV